MGRYLIRRLLISAITLVAISAILYSILYLAPGDPLSGLANNPNVPPAVREQIREQWGLNEPLHVQYFKWAESYFFHFDWGQSLTARVPVKDYIFDRVPVTLAILGTAYVIAVCIAIPVGVLSALKQYSLFDQLATTFAFFGFSIPTFFSGLLLIIIFSVQLGWFPSSFTATRDGVWPNIEQAIMPVTVLSLFSTSQLTRFVRASMLETINQDYVRTARAKGLRERAVVAAHILRNALIPVVTIIALQIPFVIGGAVITEQIFRIPGIGRALIDGILANDVPVIMAITFGIAVLVVLFNLAADILYAILDPRIKYT
ncbi:MAG: ABC transporter permease [Chloroflexia bacterium]|nr:ABC transporter permease [Chloroflexia bacterium]